MGYPLHGQDLSLDITPVQARSGWAVGWTKPAFWGRDVLLAEQRARGRAAAAGGSRRSSAASRGRDMPVPPRAATRSARSPVGHVLADACGRASRWRCSTASVGEGDEVVVDVRGRPLRFRVVKPPFVDSRPT